MVLIQTLLQTHFLVVLVGDGDSIDKHVLNMFLRLHE